MLAAVMPQAGTQAMATVSAVPDAATIQPAHANPDPLPTSPAVTQVVSAPLQASLSDTQTGFSTME